MLTAAHLPRYAGLPNAAAGESLATWRFPRYIYQALEVAERSHKRRASLLGAVSSVHLPGSMGMANAVVRRQTSPSGKFFRCICKALRECQIQPQSDKLYKAAKLSRCICQALRGCQIQLQSGKFLCQMLLRPAATYVQARAVVWKVAFRSAFENSLNAISASFAPFYDTANS